jgi:hypothetical protein
MPNPNVDRNHGFGRQASDRNRDAGADPDAEGMPDVMDDTTPGMGDVPEPERPSVPAEEPVASTAYGTTQREQAEGEWLDAKLAKEEPEEWAAEDERAGLPAEEAAVRVEQEPPD